MALQVLIQFAQRHEEFRIPELESVAETYGFKVDYPQGYDITRPFMVVHLEEEDHARKLAERCVLIKYAYNVLSCSALGCIPLSDPFLNTTRLQHRIRDCMIVIE